MKIIYIHHALREKRSEPSQEDKITKLGKQDAKNVSKILKQLTSMGLDIKAIYTSPFLRCVETSKIINKKLKVQIIKDDRFNEFKSIKNESWINLQTRVRNAIYDIVCKYKDNDSVICVTSGVNISAFISLAYKLQPSEETPFLGVPSCSIISFDITQENFK